MKLIRGRLSSRGRGPGDTAATQAPRPPAPALVSANEQPLGQERQSRSCLQESGLGLYTVCAGLWGSSPMFLGTV